MKMELYASETQIILVQRSANLWINRRTGEYIVKTEELDTISAECLGVVYGYLGKIVFDNGAEPRLAFIQRHTRVGRVKGQTLYRINSIVTVPLDSECEIFLEPCSRHPRSICSSSNAKKNFTPIVPSPKTSAINTASGSSQAASLNRVRVPAALTAKNNSSPYKRNERSEKVERRILEEFQKMFTEAESFFYSDTYDLTNSLQRQSSRSANEELALWKRCDDRFFWNKHLLLDMINSKNSAFDPWIVPIMQGFVQTETCDVKCFDTLGPEPTGTVEITIISRRCRHRAGTRYLRRGVDENGNVANYVETEQIVSFGDHTVSYVQVRGSIPVFWTQMGFKYRPPPRLERSDDENFTAFSKHFERELSLYGPITVINLVEKSGKEKVLGDAYLNNVIKYNSENISLYSFDFHEACGGMRFENVSLLIEKLADDLKSMNYCWVDKYGVVLQQQGVCRVNCVDCLDRTNVVETHIAKHILGVQLSKLGLMIPETGLPFPCLQKLQILWANNGDTISKQYAGTNALKGDFTRTGERKLTGVMKDGMNSANRYYLNRFRDASRQTAIDFILGVKTFVTEDDLDGEKGLQEDKESTLEHLKQMIEDVKKCVVPTFDIVLGSWGFINARTNELDVSDIDTIFILTDSNYYVTEYDCMLDTISETQKVPLSAIESIEIGMESCSQGAALWSIFQSAARIPCVRINYINNGTKLYHQFRTSNIRFFNNTVISVGNNTDEMLESLKMFADALEAATSIVGNSVSVLHHDRELPVKETHKGNKIPAVASNWVHKYFSFGTDEAYRHNLNASSDANQGVGGNSKLRRSSLISTPSQGDSGIGIESVSEGNAINGGACSSKKRNKIDHEDLLLGSEEDLGDKPRSIDEVNFKVDDKDSKDEDRSGFKLSARTPMEGHRSFLVPMKDLVLPSCGIISMHESNYTSSLSALLAAHELIINMDGQTSPVTPPDATNAGKCLRLGAGNESPKESLLSPSRLVPADLNRHRHSLPANSLSVQGTVLCPKRSVTPEITITEEPPTPASDNLLAVDRSVGGSKEKSPSLGFTVKRMARSTEDVTQPIKPTFQSSLFSGLNSLKGGYNSIGFPSLGLPVQSSNRSTSDLDIFSSVTAMKGSHSENLLRQDTSHPPGSSKKELVFAPLGKLARGMQSIGANYLDPRKLKGSFKNPKLEGIRMMGTKKDGSVKEDSAVLVEKIKNCKSRIVDV